MVLTSPLLIQSCFGDSETGALDDGERILRRTYEQEVICTDRRL